MAGRPSTKVTEVAKEEKKENTVDMTEIMAMMQKMQDEISKLSQKNVELEKANETLKVSPKQEVETSETIEPNEYINVMSLVDHTLNISTQGFGQGEPYKFVEYGEIQPIIYTDLSRIITNNKSFIEKNLFVILSDKVNKRHQLAKYSEIITKDMIDSIIALEPKNVDELFALLSDEQKDNVVEMIIQKTFADNGDNVDYSKLRKMSKHYKRDIQEYIEYSLDLEKDHKEEK